MLFYYYHSHHSPSSIVLMIWNSWRDKVQFQPTNLRFFLLIAIDYYGFNKALIHFLCKIVIVLRMYCKHSATYIAITCTIYSKRIAGLIALPSFLLLDADEEPCASKRRNRCNFKNCIVVIHLSFYHRSR